MKKRSMLLGAFLGATAVWIVHSLRQLEKSQKEEKREKEEEYDYFEDEEIAREFDDIKQQNT